ncbi:MFS transporter [Arthrobacter sp. 35W]|uniref:MFS transporter n=1 Tax=Arthrobacter sp. 35W TaxID=1132441 RepID=UPI0018C8E075|nr:MFS transporter [Arthrobacter sp. 35W]
MSGPRKRWGFRLVLIATTAMMAGASAPSPFYPVLQARFGFAPVTITMVFAVYAVALLALLLVGGSLSDHVGRRPVLSAGFGLLAISVFLFWHADTAQAFIASRILQGGASGLLLSALSATVVDLEPSHKPGSAAAWNSVSAMAGLAVGGLMAGFVLLVFDGGGAPLVFGTLVVVYLSIAGAVWFLPETSPRHEGVWASLRPRASLPRTMRKAFWYAAPAIVAGWATGGLYLSLGPVIVATQFHESSHLAGGLVVALLAGSGAIAGFLMRNRMGRALTLYGTMSIAIGSALAIGAVAMGSLWLYYVAVVITGTGFGTAFSGALQSLLPLIGPSQRAHVLASVFVVCYSAFSVPAVAAGLLVPVLGLFTTTCWYGAVVALMATTAAVLRRFGTRD